jgi:hypothetical protein
MKTDMKRIIHEELSRLMEGDVVYPKFGGGEPPDEEPSLFLKTLQGIEEMLIEAIGDDDLNEEQNDALNDLLDQVQDMMQEDGGDDDEPFGGGPTGSERSELERFKSWMKRQD